MSLLRTLLLTALLATPCTPVAHAGDTSDEPAEVHEDVAPADDAEPAAETADACDGDEPAPVAEEPVEAESCDDEEPSEDSIPAELDDEQQFLEDVLADGVVACGTVKVAGTATVTRELRLGDAVKAKAAMPRRRAKPPKGVLVAKVRRKAGKAGTVQLTCKLTRRGRRALRGRDGVTLLTRTTVKRKRLKPVVTTGALSLV